MRLRTLVRAGGAANHRFGLYDAVLIKDNHIAVAGGIAAALKAAQDRADGVPIEIEVDTLAQFTEALDSGAQCHLPECATLSSQSLASTTAASNLCVGSRGGDAHFGHAFLFCRGLAPDVRLVST